MAKVTVIGMEIANPGNLGAIARVMQNFGLDKLALINPKCNHLSKEALDRATHAKSILQNAEKIVSLKEARRKFDTLVGTTARTGTDYNLQRTPLSPVQFSGMLSKYAGTHARLVESDDRLALLVRELWELAGVECRAEQWDGPLVDDRRQQLDPLGLHRELVARSSPTQAETADRVDRQGAHPLTS